MTVTLDTRFDIDLATYRRVAWGHEELTIGEDARAVMRAARRSFLALLDREPDRIVYSVNTLVGESVSVVLDPTERDEAAKQLPGVRSSWGEPLPERIVRGVLVARLANLLDGHAGVRPELADRVASILNRGSLPAVPSRGNGGSGEVVALSHLIDLVAEGIELGPKEGVTFINGSPCAAALLADSALAAPRAVRLAEQAFCLSAGAFATTRRSTLGADVPPPACHQMLPQVLAQVRSAAAAAEQGAQISLQAVTDNPVYILPDATRPLGTVISTGGFHNAMAAPLLDAMTRSWADLCQLAERHTAQLLMMPPGHASRQAGASELHMLQRDLSEDARGLAQPTILFSGGMAQNDTVSPTFVAWQKHHDVRERLLVALTILAVVATRALAGEPGRVPADARYLCEKVTEALALASDVGPAADPELSRLVGHLTAQLFEPAEGASFLDDGWGRDAVR